MLHKEWFALSPMAEIHIVLWRPKQINKIMKISTIALLMVYFVDLVKKLNWKFVKIACICLHRVNALIKIIERKKIEKKVLNIF